MVNIIHLGPQLSYSYIPFQLVTIADIQVATIVMWFNIVKMHNFNSHVYTHFRSIIRVCNNSFRINKLWFIIQYF